MLKFIKQFFIGLLLLPLFFVPLNAESVRPILGPILYGAVWDITSYGGGDQALTLNLTNTADLVSWQAEYAPSNPYSRASAWYVLDYQRVLQSVASGVPAFYGARWTGTEWVDTEVDGVTPLTNTIGLAFWPSTTNVIPADEYRDFTHVNWVKTNGSITAGNVTLIDGTVVADQNTFTASAGNATIIKTAYVSASGVHAGGFFVKRKTGTGTVEVCVDNGTTWVDVTTLVDSDSGWHMPQTTLPTVTDPQVGLRLVTSGDAVYLDWAQLDDGLDRVSVHPIPGSETLAAQACIAASAANASKLIDNAQGYVYVEAMVLPDDSIASSNGYFIGNGERVLYGLDAILRSYDGSNLSFINSAYSGYSKLVSYWWDSSKQITSNTNSSAVGTYDGAWGSTSIYVGTINGSSSGINGGISKVIFGKGIKTTQAKMEVLTTPDPCIIPIGYIRLTDELGNYLTDESGNCIIVPRN